MTWRERIVAARARGCFSAEDREAWEEPSICLVGEQRQRLGIDCALSMGFLTRDIQAETLHAINENDFDGLDRLLDVIEDRALELKREQMP